MATLQNKINAALTAKENIRLALNRKGRAVTNVKPLDLYPDEVEAITQGGDGEGWVSEATGAYLQCIGAELDVVIPPTINGHPVTKVDLSTNFASQVPASRIIKCIKNLTLPDSCITFYRGTSSDYSEVADVIHLNNCNRESLVGASYLVGAFRGFSLMDSNIVELVPDSSNNYDTPWACPRENGVISLPMLETLGCRTPDFCPNSGGVTSFTVKLPAIKTITHTSTSYGLTGIPRLELGTNLESIDSNTTTVLTNLGATKVFIPAGDSTTKTTLDTAGVGYTQMT